MKFVNLIFILFVGINVLNVSCNRSGFLEPEPKAAEKIATRL